MFHLVYSVRRGRVSNIGWPDARSLKAKKVLFTKGILFAYQFVGKRPDKEYGNAMGRENGAKKRTMRSEEIGLFAIYFRII